MEISIYLDKGDSVTITGRAKEIAALILELREKQEMHEIKINAKEILLQQLERLQEYSRKNVDPHELCEISNTILELINR